MGGKRVYEVEVVDPGSGESKRKRVEASSQDEARVKAAMNGEFTGEVVAVGGALLATPDAPIEKAESELLLRDIRNQISDVKLEVEQIRSGMARSVTRGVFYGMWLFVLFPIIVGILVTVGLIVFGGLASGVNKLVQPAPQTAPKGGGFR